MNTTNYKFNKLIKYIFIIGLLATASIYVFVKRNISYINKNIENITNDSTLQSQKDENIFDLVNEIDSETGDVFVLDGIKDGQTVTGIVPIFINPKNDVPIKKVSFYIGKTLIEEDSSTPYNSIWDTRKTKDGVQVLYIKITKQDNEVIELKPITITVTNPEMDTSEIENTPDGLPRPELY